MALLAEHGYNGTGLKMILDAVQIPKGSFYNYFESKEQFVAEIIREYSSSLMVKFDRFVEESDQDPLGIIKTLYYQLLQSLEAQNYKKGCLLGDLAAEIGGQSEQCQRAMQWSYRQWQVRMVNLLKMAQQSGVIRTDIEAEQLSEIFWSYWEGTLLRMKIEGDVAGAKQSLDSVLDVLFKS